MPLVLTVLDFWANGQLMWLKTTIELRWGETEFESSEKGLERRIKMIEVIYWVIGKRIGTKNYKDRTSDNVDRWSECSENDCSLLGQIKSTRFPEKIMTYHVCNKTWGDAYAYKSSTGIRRKWSVHRRQETSRASSVHLSHFFSISLHGRNIDGIKKMACHVLYQRLRKKSVIKGKSLHLHGLYISSWIASDNPSPLTW